MLIEFELIERAKSGDESAFNQVLQAYRKRILGTIARLIGKPEAVEDVGQEVFLRLFYSLDQLRTPEVFEPWLYRLTVNAAYDYLRRQRRRRESRMSDLSEQQVMRADASAGGKWLPGYRSGSGGARMCAASFAHAPAGSCAIQWPPRCRPRPPRSSVTWWRSTIS